MRRSGIVERVADRAAVRRWQKLSRSIDRLPLSELKDVRVRAKSMQSALYRVLARTEDRLIAPTTRRETIRGALGADWSWRPHAWRCPISPHGASGMENGHVFGDCLKVFHDCPLQESALRQGRNTRATDLAPYGISLDFFGFEGSFFSVVVDLPDSGLAGLGRQNLIRVETEIECEFKTKIFARLNLKNGPNTAQMVAELDINAEGFAEFDLGYSDINEARIEAAWVELIFENPNNNHIRINDLTLLRRVRAEL